MKNDSPGTGASIFRYRPTRGTTATPLAGDTACDQSMAGGTRSCDTTFHACQRAARLGHSAADDWRDLELQRDVTRSRPPGRASSAPAEERESDATRPPMSWRLSSGVF